MHISYLTIAAGIRSGGKHDNFLALWDFDSFFNYVDELLEFKRQNDDVHLRFLSGIRDGIGYPLMDDLGCNICLTLLSIFEYPSYIHVCIWGSLDEQRCYMCTMSV